MVSMTTILWRATTPLNKSRLGNSDRSGNRVGNPFPACRELYRLSLREKAFFRGVKDDFVLSHQIRM